MPKAIKFEEVCPYCGSHLIAREGEYGEFLACPRFPACKFTKPLPDGDLKLYKPPSPYCGKCNHTGLIPSRVLGKFSGKPIPNCLEDCECKDSIPEHYPPLSPSDFDFPMSYDFHRSLCNHHGWQDPGSCELPEERSRKEAYAQLDEQPKTTVVIHRSAAKEAQRISQLEAKVNYLLKERLNKRKKGRYLD